MGVSADHKEEKQLSEKILSLLNKAGYGVIYPENLNNLCCGMAFSSKGYTEAGEKVGRARKSPAEGHHKRKIPIVCDMSPCLYTMKDNFKVTLSFMNRLNLSLSI